MSGLCGWIGDGAAAGEPAPALEGMLGRLPAYRPGTAQSWAGPDRALGLRAEAVTGSWHVIGETAAAIEGYPVWDDPELAQAAAAQGHAAALIAAFARHGAGLLDRLRGAFALAVVDGRAQRALAAIDRMGVYPLCHARAGADGVVFGSTADAVRAHPSVAATVRPQAVYDYLYFIDRVPAPETIYEEQRKLPPGHYLLFEGGAVTVAPYWRLTYGAGPGRSRQEWGAALLGHLRRAVGASLDGEDPTKVGTFLSGGLDSTTVLGLLAEAGPRPKAFTIGFGVEGFDETPYARVSAGFFDADHDVYYVEPDDVVEVVPRIAEAYDEPFGNSSAIPAYYCARRAREAGVDMMLAGDGGDELFAGNSRYVADAVFERYGWIPSPLRRGLIEPLAAALAPLDAVPSVRKARRYVALARMSVPERLHRDNVYRDWPPAEIFADEMLAALSPEAPVSLANRIFEETASTSKLHRMMHLDLRMTLADSDIRKVSRMCEMAGVRVRYPFLDDDLVAFSAGIPPELLLEGGALRAFYKAALADFLPSETIAKTKKGFGLPFLNLVATHGPLRELACDCLLGLKARAIFRAAFLERLADTLASGALRAEGAVVWDLMMLEFWFRARQS